MKTDYSEAVFFFGKKGIAKEMLYTEFEAVLDGVVGIPEFAGTEVQACYLTITGDLTVNTCVLFLIEFDHSGRADRDWNIPLRHLAENAGPGPDLGSGPIRLACRSQCSVAWYQRELWEPTARDGMNHFFAIRDAVTRNKLGLVKKAPMQQYQPEVPVINDPVPPVLDTVFAAQPQAPAGIPKEEVEQELKQRDEHYKQQMTTLATDYRQKLQALDERRKQEVDQIKRVMRNESQAHKQQALQVEQQLSQQTVLYESLIEKFTKLTEDHELLQAGYDAQRDKLEQLKDQHLDLLQQQNQTAATESEEVEALRKTLAATQIELENHKENQIRMEHELKDTTASIEVKSQEALDNFVDRLHRQDLVFVAYHPGAGHMSLPAKMLTDYLEDPYTYAAQKCSVNVSQYRDWVAHYEQAVCQECGVPVKRVDNPSDYIEGHHNYCVRHKKVSGNVSPLRRSG